MRRLLRRLAALAALCGPAAALAGPLSARALADGVWVVEGENADFTAANACRIINTAFIATGDGVLVINTGPSRQAGEALRRLAEQTAGEPVREVIHLNLHPDYFLGNQAFADVPRFATPSTREGMRREAAAYEQNLYRICGDAMAGTEALLPDRDIAPGRHTLGRRTFELIALDGHTASDLVLVDRTSGIVFAGGLAFRERIPTTPHADLPRWRESLARLAALSPAIVVPSHGPVRPDAVAITQTADYLRWLDGHLCEAAARGLDIAELLRQGLPARYRDWAAADTEYARNLSQLYPRYEAAQFGATAPACHGRGTPGVPQ